ncbi:MAG: endonuclease/exonuclease/phosphatase [Chloroflexi bacterium HGW-Chloroflexi-2]|nr:MAG: endonuclease/exonuclease/phosphatase [Chloroflexi bacterium HGW-Chloroflexi-2]
MASVLAWTSILGEVMPHQIVQAETAELFFSEYIEGSSFNKALEIFNGTGAPIDLTVGGYNIQMFFNGSSTAGLTINLIGTVSDGDVFVVTNASAIDSIKSVADQITTATNWYNGDDAVVLRKGTSIIDSIGQIGFDPGSAWISGSISTIDNTLRRKFDICEGDLEAYDAFDPAYEWDGFPKDSIDGLGSHLAECGQGSKEPKINEFLANHVGTDIIEYVEIYGEPNTDYSAYKILEIEGDFYQAVTGTIDEVIPLGTTDSNGLYLANLPANALENGTLTLLLVKNFTGALGNDLDTNEDGIFDIYPWDTIVDAVAVNDGGASDLTYGVPVLTAYYDGLPYVPGGASRIPDGYDTDVATDWIRNDFDLAGIPGFTGTITLGEAYNTPGLLNMIYETPPPPPEQCGDPYTTISSIQGIGLESPFKDSFVSTEGVVTATFDGKNGFFIQDPIGDDNPDSSEGIFIYLSGFILPEEFSNWDTVRVRGSVSEFNGLTEITITQLWICNDIDPENSAEPIETITPTEITLPVTTVDEFEKFEGMLVALPQALTISEYFNFDRYGEIVLTTERYLTFTAEYEPSILDYLDAVEEFKRNRIIIDDGRTAQNPDPAIHPNGSIFDLGNLFRGGDTVANVTGIMDYGFSEYRIQPTQGADYTGINPRTNSPEDVGGDIKVASFNVLNYFTTLNSRGANTIEEFVRQRAKIIAAISVIDADVVGLMEIENNNAAIMDLVAGLNGLMGQGTYAYVDTGVIGTDEIKVAMIYKPSTVDLYGSHAILDNSVDPRFLDTKNRPALAQSFMDKTNGGVFTVAVNHLKSKGSDCNDVGDPDLGDGAGNCNLTRLNATQALVDWLADDPTESGSKNYLIIGDLNSYDKEDPIDAILAGPDDVAGTEDDYTDLLFHYVGEDAYTYVFDGQIGYLDHALVNSDLFDMVTGTTVWHINADEPDLIDYDMSFKLPAQDALYAPDPFRSSDHDPVIVGLKVCELVPPSVEVTVTPDLLWPPNHKYVDVVATVTAWDNFDLDPQITLVSVSSNEPDNGDDDGNTIDDIVIVDKFTFKLRAERSDTGTGRIYTITYMVTDACGNTTYQSAMVYVPISMGE